MQMERCACVLSARRWSIASKRVCKQFGEEFELFVVQQIRMTFWLSAAIASAISDSAADMYVANAAVFRTGDAANAQTSRYQRTSAHFTPSSAHCVSKTIALALHTFPEVGKLCRFK